MILRCVPIIATAWVNLHLSRPWCLDSSYLSSSPYIFALPILLSFLTKIETIIIAETRLVSPSPSRHRHHHHVTVTSPSPPRMPPLRPFCVSVSLACRRLVRPGGASVSRAHNSQLSAARLTQNIHPERTENASEFRTPVQLPPLGRPRRPLSGMKT